MIQFIHLLKATAHYLHESTNIKEDYMRDDVHTNNYSGIDYKSDNKHAAKESSNILFQELSN